MSRKLVDAANRLDGVSLAPRDDFLDTLTDLDEALAGGPPVAVCLDELDTLLLPEREGAGRRAASALGRRTFANLVVMGTVRRFHRSIHEFAYWTMIECPADLAWADGVTYFMDLLDNPRPGPAWPNRATVTPDLFANEIEPVLGLRPYFWGQLRNRLEMLVPADGTGSRLIRAADLRRERDALVTHDPHLAIVTERAADLAYLDPEELRRRDLFSAAEQAILVLLARLPVGQRTVSAAEAAAAGGEDAIEELLDRAYLSYDETGTRLRCAVPIFQVYLRTKVRVLEQLTAPKAVAPKAAGSKPVEPNTVAPKALVPTIVMPGADPKAAAPKPAGAQARRVRPRADSCAIGAGAGCSSVGHSGRGCSVIGRRRTGGQSSGTGGGYQAGQGRHPRVRLPQEPRAAQRHRPASAGSSSGLVEVGHRPQAEDAALPGSARPRADR